MIVTVKTFAALREIIGSASVAIDVSSDASVRDVIKAVSERYPGIGIIASQIIIAVNMEYVSFDHPVHESDEVALIPPVSGGSK
ncbi:MAG: molybdopterin synthase catalytic subunit [Chloroflexi bacterium]|nr:MAG: molybdopterin synthase catalytic subunit [Chloroflexota bacterium]